MVSSEFFLNILPKQENYFIVNNLEIVYVLTCGNILIKNLIRGRGAFNLSMGQTLNQRLRFH